MLGVSKRKTVEHQIPKRKQESRVAQRVRAPSRTAYTNATAVARRAFNSRTNGVRRSMSGVSRVARRDRTIAIVDPVATSTHRITSHAAAHPFSAPKALGFIGTF